MKNNEKQKNKLKTRKNKEKQGKTRKSNEKQGNLFPGPLPGAGPRPIEISLFFLVFPCFSLFSLFLPGLSQEPAPQRLPHISQTSTTGLLGFDCFSLFPCVSLFLLGLCQELAPSPLRFSCLHCVATCNVLCICFATVYRILMLLAQGSSSATPFGAVRVFE